MENNIKTKQGRRFLKGYSLEPDVLIQGEKVLFQAKPLSWLKLGEPLVAIIIALVFILILPYLSRTFPEVGQTELVDFWIILRWFGICILVIGIIAMVARWFKWYSRIYIVTNKRVIEGSGTIGRLYIDCSLSRIQNIIVNISILGRMFGYGTVGITTASNSKYAIKWENVRDPLGTLIALNIDGQGNAVQRDLSLVAEMQDVVACAGAQSGEKKVDRARRRDCPARLRGYVRRDGEALCLRVHDPISGKSNLHLLCPLSACPLRQRTALRL